MADSVVDRGSPLDLYLQDTEMIIPHEQTLALDTSVPTITSSTNITPIHDNDHTDEDDQLSHPDHTIRKQRRRNGMLIRGANSSAADSYTTSESEIENEPLQSASQSQPYDPFTALDAHTMNIQAPLSPLDGRFHSLRHQQSTTTTLHEPPTPIASLTPPPNFQEKFQYIICSSGLLDAEPKGGRKRTSSGYGRFYRSFMGVASSATDPERSSFSAPGPSRLRLSLQSQPGAEANSIASTTYLTASTTSSRGSTPTMTLNPLPIVDFERPLDSPLSKADTTATLMPPVEGDNDTTLRQRKRRPRPSIQRSQSTSSSFTPTPIYRFTSLPASWSSLLYVLVKLSTRGAWTLAGCLFVWAYLQMSLVLQLVAWALRLCFGSSGGKGKGKKENVKRRRRIVEPEIPQAGQNNVKQVENVMLPGSTDSATLDRVTEQSSVNLAPTQDQRNETSSQSLQGAALDMLSTLVKGNEAFETVAGQVFDRLTEIEHDDEHNPMDDPMRQKLHGALTEITQTMSSATESLTPLVSDAELSGLLQLYKIDSVCDELLSPGEDHYKRYSTSSRDSLGDRPSRGSYSGHSRTGKPTTPIEYELPGLGPITPLSETSEEDQPEYPFPHGMSGHLSRHRMASEMQPPPVSMRPLPSRLRSSRSASSLRKINTANEDKFTPLPVPSPRPSSALGQNSWNARNRKRTTSLVGGLSGLYRSNSGASQKAESATRSRFGRSQHRGTPSQPLNLNASHGWQSNKDRSNVVRPPSRASQGGGQAVVEDSSTSGPVTIPVPAPSASKLRPLRLSASAIGSDRLSKSYETPNTAVPLISPALSDFSSTSFRSRNENEPLPGSHQRKRSSLQSLGFRRPSSVAALRPTDSPRNARPPSRPETNLESGMAEFVKGLPVDLVSSLTRRASADPGHSSRSSHQSFYQSRLDHHMNDPDNHSGNTQEGLFRLSGPSRPSSIYPANTVAPLTISSLRIMYKEMHSKRRQTACYLLALHFDNQRTDPVALARYWADIHAVLTNAKSVLTRATSEMEGMLEKSSLGQPWCLSPNGNAFAPKPSDTRLLQRELDDLGEIINLASQRIHTVKQMTSAQAGNHAMLVRQSDLLREELGQMIGRWERGRAIVNRMTGREGISLSKTQTFSETPWVDVLSDREANTSTDMSLPSIPSMDEIDPDIDVHKSRDDATDYLLDSASPAILPPVGTEAVFEDYVERLLPLRALTNEGRKLTREDRIKATRSAREQNRAKREGDENCPPNRADVPVQGQKQRNGEMMGELKEVIALLKNRNA